MGALLILTARYPTRASFLLDARTALWAYGIERQKRMTHVAAQHLLAVAREPTCIPDWRFERDATTSKFRFVVTRESPGSPARAA